MCVKLVKKCFQLFIFLISKARYINEEAESYKYTGGILSNNPLSKPKTNKAHLPLVGRQPFQKPYKGHTLLTNIQSSPAPQTTNKRIVKLLDI